MNSTIKAALEKIRKSEGFLTAKGKIYDRGELFHTFLPSFLLGFMGLVTMFGALFTAVLSGSKLSGHLGDFRKNIGYGIGGFFLGYLPHLVGVFPC